MNRRRRSEAGLALLSVLWILLLLSALAASAVYVARTQAMLTHRSLELAQAQAATDAAIVDTISRLSDDQVARHPPVDGTQRTWEFGGVSLQIAVSNESGRIDLNGADPKLLAAFLESQGVPAEQVTKLIEAIRPTQGMTERKPMLDTTEAVGELDGWKSQPLACWLNSLTVYTGLPGVAPRYASEATLAALQRLGSQGPAEVGSTATVATTPDPPTAQSLLGEVLRIRATATFSNDVTTTSEWVGRLTGDRRKPMLTMRWDHGVVNQSSACGNAQTS